MSARIKEVSTRLRCEITGKLLPPEDLVPLDHLRSALSQRIKRDFPELAPEALIARKEVDRYRMLYVEELLNEERGELSDMDRQVAKSLACRSRFVESKSLPTVSTRGVWLFALVN
jgi:hypothetical protein